MDTPVKADAGAGVGKSGVVTPYETGNRGNTSDWALRGLGPKDPEIMNGNRRNSAGTGREWDRPWQSKDTVDHRDVNELFQKGTEVNEK